MARQISKEQLLAEKGCEGIVMLNVQDDVETFIKKGKKYLAKSYAPLLENIEYLKHQKGTDFIIRKRDVPEDIISQIQYGWLLDMYEATTTLTVYRARLRKAKNE